MNKETQILALELELHGVEQELKEKKTYKKSIDAAVSNLEGQKLQLEYEIKRLRGSTLF